MQTQCNSLSRIVFVNALLFTVVTFILLLCFIVAPKIETGDLRDLKVRLGQGISLKVRFSGEPAPEVHWTINGLSPTNRTEVHATGLMTTLETSHAQREDSGIYTIHVKNSSGHESAQANVTVVGK